LYQVQFFLVGQIVIIRDQRIRIGGGKFGLKPIKIQERRPRLFISVRLMEVSDKMPETVKRNVLDVSRAANMPAKLRTKRAGSSVAGVSARQQW
jgi:hypothetical protein